MDTVPAAGGLRPCRPRRRLRTSGGPFPCPPPVPLTLQSLYCPSLLFTSPLALPPYSHLPCSSTPYLAFGFAPLPMSQSSPSLLAPAPVAILEEDKVAEAEAAWGRILVGTCLGRIASLIGIPLYLDSPALKTCTAYARVCVEVEAGTELPDEVFVEVRNGDREAIRIMYDWKPQACSHCQTFGHDDMLCCKKPRSFIATPKYLNSKDLNSKGTAEKDFASLPASKSLSERSHLDSLGLFYETPAKEDYLLLLRREEDLLRQKSRQTWLQNGDRNSKFFYASLKAKAATNTIRNVKLSDGSISFDP
ncbi:hypothetical protein QJS10_CPB19g00461 [Acorus calamus]|uniref:DUF4283 domain-containing protein n=1 Tax=Acorus calamus TaxID=4465 RepID=A0AAV9CDV1_ACOCL|nr:hypothetical protein QJS10_CPB19g00461 [Acorus calamus]